MRTIFVIIFTLCVAISFCQDTTYDTRSLRIGQDNYTIVFAYKANPDSVRHKVIKVKRPLKFDSTGHVYKDTIVADTQSIYFYKSLAVLYKEIDGIYKQISDTIHVPFVLGEDSFVNRIYIAALRRLKHNYDPSTGKLVELPQPPTAPGGVQSMSAFFGMSAERLYAAAAGHTAHYIYAVQRPDKSFWMSAGENHGSTGDTIVLRSTLGSWTYGYISVNNASNVVVWTEGPGQVKFTSGITVENTNNLSILGLGADSAYGIAITGGGTNMTIVGKNHHIEVGYIDMRNGGVGGLWDKTEASDVQNRYACDLSYLTDTASYHHLHHIRLRNIHGDAVYFMSTGGDGGRPMTCGGTTTFPIPPGATHAEIDHFVLDSVNRTGIQMSLTFGGGNSMHDCIITNMGYEYNTSQGAGAALGSKDDSVSVYNMTINHTFIYNFYSYAKHPKVYNNNFDSAGRVGTTGSVGAQINSQQIPSMLASASQANTTIDFENNTVGFNSAVPSTQLVVYDATPPLLTVSGNIACNTGARVTNNTTRTFVTTCGGAINLPPVVNAGVDQSIIQPINSVNLNATITDEGGNATIAWTKLSGGTFTINNANIKNPVISNLQVGSYTFKATATDSLGLTGTDNIVITVSSLSHTPPVVSAGVDDSITLPVSTYNLKGFINIAPHIQFGGVFQHVNITQKIAAAKLAGLTSVRQSTTFQTWNGVNIPSVDSTMNAGLKATLNLNDSVTSSTTHWGPVSTWVSNVNKVVTNPLYNPNKIVLFGHNEEANPAYRAIVDTPDLAGYIPLLDTLARLGHKHGFKVSNGGLEPNNLVFATYRWLSDTHNPDTVNFLKYCIPYKYWSQAVNRTGSVINYQIGSIKYLLSRYDTLPIDYINVHLYPPFAARMDDTTTNYSYAYTGIQQIMNMIRTYTTKPIVCNEYAIVQSRNNDSEQIAVINDLRTAGVRILDYYNDTSRLSPLLPIVDENQALTAVGIGYKTIVDQADDDLAASKLWTEVSGPTYIISNTGIDSPIVSSLLAGTYILRYTVTDSAAATSYDEMSLKVKNVTTNIPPVANAGLDVRITDVTTTIFLSGIGSYDVDGQIKAWKWQETKGLPVIITDTSAAITQIAGLKAGNYTFSLTVTDNDGATNTDAVNVTVQGNSIYPSSRIKVGIQ